MDVRNRVRNRAPWLIGLALVACMTAVVWIVLSDGPLETPAERSVQNATTQSPVTTPEQTQPQKPSDPSRDKALLSAGGTLRGRVIDAITRQPVRDFKVEFHQAQGTSWRKDTPTGRNFRAKDGRFAWKPAPAGIWMVTVSASGYQRFEIGRVRIERDTETTEFVMPLRKGVLVRGRVLDKSSGAPIAAASVSFRDAEVAAFEGNFRSRPRTLTNKDGSFSLDGVPLGRIALVVSAQSHSSREINIAVNETTPTVEVALSMGGSISGRLVAEDGMTGVPGWAGLFNLDQHYGSNGRTNELGEFEFKQLSAGRYRLSGQAEGMTVTRDVALSDGQQLEGITLVLAAGRTIRGTVSGLSVAELSQVRIDLIRPDGADELTFAEPKVDPQGAFELRGLRPGPAIIEARTQRRAIRRSFDIPLDADVIIDLSFEAGFGVRGRITKGGKPLVGVGVELYASDRDGFPSFGVETAQDGRYVFEGVPRGNYSIVAGAFESRTILVSDDTEIDIDIPTIELNGEVLDEDGEAPVVGARVAVWSTPSSLRAVRRLGRSDHFGRFSVGSLDAGSYVLTVYRPGFSMHREQIELPIQSSIAIRLSADEGVKVQAHDRSTGKSLTRVRMYEQFGREASGIAMAIALDEQGEGRIPSGLVGSPLVFTANGCDSITIQNWNGQPLRLLFRCAGAQVEPMSD